MKARGRARSSAAYRDSKPARDDFGAAVVVRHVEAVEAGRRIGGERVGAAFGVERRAAALLVGDLPEAGEDARNREVGRERDPRERRRRHFVPSFAFRALTSSVLISPVVVTLPSVIFHKRNGPVMSPYWSKLTGPITPS